MSIFSCGEKSNRDSSEELNDDRTIEYGSSNEDSELENESDYPDDTYSVTVDFYNPDKG